MKPVAARSFARPATHQAARPAPAPVEPAPVAKAAPAKVEPPRQPGAHRTGFKAQEFIVYPAHGVGQILAIEEQEVAGFKLELFVINFSKDKMTLKVPLPKVISGAIRKLADEPTVKKALDTLTGRARVKRTMWSRRAQEYEAKINSGDLIAIAEVVRDLYRSEAQPEQSYSERQLYEAAVDRMARELGAVRKLTETESLKLVEQHLERGPKRGPRNEAQADDAEGEADADSAEGEIEAAA
jgi:CarD family transcriptional regulator